MTTESITFKVGLDARNLDKELAEARSRVMQFGGAAADVGRRVDELRTKQMELALALASVGKEAAIDQGKMFALRTELEATTRTLSQMTGQVKAAAPEMQAFGYQMDNGAAKTLSATDHAKKLQAGMAPLAAAISSVSISLQMQGGEVGKVIGAAGQLAAAFGAAGPLGVALVGTTILVDKLTASWEAEIAAEDAARTAKFASVDKVIANNQSIEDELKRLRSQLTPATLQEEVAPIYKEIAANEERIIALKNQAASARLTYEERQIPKNEAILLGKQNDLLREKINLEAAVFGQRNAKRSTVSALAAPKSGDDQGTAAFMRAVEAARAQRERDNAPLDAPSGLALGSPFAAGGGVAGVKRGSAGRSSMVDDTERDLNLMGAMWKDYGLTVKKVAEESAADFTNTTQQSFNVGLSAFRGYLDAKITGADDAEAMLAATVLRGIGDQLVGFGTQQAFKGAGYLIDSAGADPRGYANLALGSAAIAAGVGMGAAGTAISAGAQAARVTPASDDRERARTDRGANRGGSGSGSSGGPTVINVVSNYGLGVPQEVAARDMTDLLNFARRNGYAVDREGR